MSTGYSSESFTVAISTDDYLYFVDRALDGMRAIATQLGDDRINVRADVPGANTAYALITHCLGVADYWAGHLVAGRLVRRDRDAEFGAAGSVADIVARIDSARQQLAADLAHVDSGAAPAAAPDPQFLGPDRELDQGGALVHLLEELVQHHGQLQVLRDVLLRDAPQPAFEPELAWLRGKRGVKWARPGPDALPSWVADMDFPVAPVIRTALVEAIDRGDLGYPDWPDDRHPLADAFAARMAARFGWDAEPLHVRGVTDVIAALQIVLDLATEPGDAVVLQEPNYPPFRATPPTMRRRAVPLHVVADGESWRLDLDALDATLRTTRARVLLLVNPHNPTGRVLRRDELRAVAELAERHDLIVVSDEIHADLTYAPAEHVPLASLGDDIAARTVTVTSATKAFNIAGLRTAVAHIGPRQLRARWDAEPPDVHGVASNLGVVATHAAWTGGDQWLAGAVAHLQRQRDRLIDGLADLPVTVRAPQAGYLAWLDWGAAGLGEDAAAYFLREARVFASPGPDYGGTPDWMRLNFATSTEVLDEIIGRLRQAVR